MFQFKSLDKQTLFLEEKINTRSINLFLNIVLFLSTPLMQRKNSAEFINNRVTRTSAQFHVKIRGCQICLELNDDLESASERRGT